MSETSYMDQTIEAFGSSHSHEDGWKVYELFAELGRKRFLHYFLDFIRDRHPETVERWAGVKVVLGEELLGTSPFAHAADPGTEWDLSRELDSDGWFGCIHIRWEGQPIHVVSFLLNLGHDCQNMFRVASRSNVALRKMLQGLEQYGQSRKGEPAHQIYVVNADNIPIEPVCWEDIFLPPAFVESIRTNVTGFFQSEDRYKALGIPYHRGLLFTGPPGCGKTLMVKALVYNTPAEAVTVLGSANVSDEDITSAFQYAARHAPAILILEELEKLTQAKGVALSFFLDLLDGLRSLRGIMIIATANQPELLDPALLHRPSRFDRVWTFPLPAMEQRLALLRRKGGASFSEPALEDAARRSQGFSMAYVQEIVVNALLESAHSGTPPSDSALLRSLDTLRSQRKDATRKLDSLAEPDSVGFALNGG